MIFLYSLYFYLLIFFAFIEMSQEQFEAFIDQFSLI